MFNSLLVELGYFETITVGFLIIGHTHASIDQYFSCLRRLIRNAEFIASPLALRHLFSIQPIQTNSKKKKYRPPILQVQIHFVHDYVTFFEPYQNKDIVGYGVPYQFRIFKVLGRAVCQYKQFSDPTIDWLPKQPKLHPQQTLQQFHQENVSYIEDHLSLESDMGRLSFMGHLGIRDESSKPCVEEFVQNKNGIRDKAQALQKALPLLTKSISVKASQEQEMRRCDEERGINHIKRYEVDNDIMGAQTTLQMNNNKESGLLFQELHYACFVLDLRIRFFRLSYMD